MSRHIYNTQTDELGDVQVVLGYDRPLDYVFCTISTKKGFLYSNMSDIEALTTQQDVGYYRDILAQHGITVPESMFEQVELDQFNREGNRVVDHTPAPIIPPGTMAELAAELKAEHEGQVYCDVCDLWYDKDEPCKFH